MKKLFLYMGILALGLVSFSSCEKEEIGGVATQELAGEWLVIVDAVDADGNIVIADADFFGLGYIHLDTYNTFSNTSTEMWLDDLQNFWAYKVKVDVDFNGRTFQSADAQNEYYDITVDISNGEILYDATTTPSGSAADSIVFNVNFSDDTYPVDYGFDSYRVSGYRYTGFENDN